MEKNFIKNKVPKYLKLLIIILIPILIYLIPVEYIEANPAICLFRTLFNKRCIGCGITRSIINTIHFNFDKAISYNALVIVVFPLIVGSYIKYIYRYINTLKNNN